MTPITSFITFAGAPGGDDWDTFSMGAGTIQTMTSIVADITYNPSYPNETASSQFNPRYKGLGVSPYMYVPMTSLVSPVLYDFMAPYAAMYVTPEEAASGAWGTQPVSGWWVYGPGAPSSPTQNGNFIYNLPVAWPTGAIGDGYFGTHNGYVHPMAVVWLSDYTGDTGEGGTDTWTPPLALLPLAAALQTITWTMTSADTATVVSSGLDIIDATKTTQLASSGGGPRLWNGAEANKYGATNKVFASAALCNDWWEDNYQAWIRQDGGPWITMHGGTPNTEGQAHGDIHVDTQVDYNDIGTGSWTTLGWVPHAAGQVTEIYVFARGALGLPGEETVLIAERLEDYATSMTTTTQGWLKANQSYDEQLDAFSPTTALRANDNNYPRLRHIGAGASVDIIMDVKFNDVTEMNTWLGAQDLSTLRARLTITEGGVVTHIATSQPYDTNSTGSIINSNTQPQVRMKLDTADFTTGTYPTAGTSATDWTGKPEGWTLSSGVLIEFFHP
jgi:hypothetical protein